MVSVIIPARFGSSRFPGKPLADIFGKPMIQWVYERVNKAPNVHEVLIATDDCRIYNVVEGFGGKVVMTSSEHISGTDRVYEASKVCKGDVIINIQGDEPLIKSELVEEFINFMEHPEVEMGTIATTRKVDNNFQNPNCVKVVIDQAGNALYFSRSPLPHSASAYHQHIGIYGFKKQVLKKFVELKNSGLEKTERLEQLRALENGIKIKVLIKELTVHHPVDTKEDLEIVKEIISKNDL